ncbi:MAG: O-antigen ligase family protein [Candidatus Sumerlaeaceae bacterium]|nr:O-antigen ligase family protein [Candidatus Sumerlaeaceae bacterium]
MVSSEDTRGPQRQPLLWALLLALWVVGVWRPPDAYPLGGILLACALALCACVAAAVGGAKKAARKKSLAQAGTAAAAALLIYVYLRWLTAGYPAVGVESVITLSFGALTGTAAFLLGASRGDRNSVTVMLRVVTGLAILCALHALAQYAFLYDRAYESLKASLEGRRPTALDMAMLHHLKLKRVASVWGDPNVFGGFLGLSVAASLALVRAPRSGRRRHPDADTLAGVAGLLAAGAGIVLSGSRGGILTAGFCGLLMWRPRLPQPSIAVALILLIFVAFPRPMTGETTAPATRFEPQPAQPAGIAGMLVRSDTIRERIHYMRIGIGIFAAHPLWGAGPGGVDLFYGRFKPPDANESKYLHNWVLQAGAEWGAAGLLMMMAFVAALLACAWQTAHIGLQERAVAVMAAGFLVDGLYSLSFHDTGLVMLFGLAVGTLLSGDADPGVASTWSRPRILWIGALALVMAVHVLPALGAEALRDAADTAIEEGDGARATTLLRRAAALAPRDPRPSLGLAAVAEMEGNPGQALLFARRALRIQPASAAINATVARLELAVGDKAAAESAIRRALELYPNNAAYHDQHARILAVRGDRKAAIAAARRAVELGGLDKDQHEALLRELEGGPPR